MLRLAGERAFRYLLVVTFALLATGAHALEPSARVPPAATVTADDYFPLLVQWTQDVALGDMSAAVTYLDPAILIAAAKQDGEVTDAQASLLASGFPDLLRVRIAFHASAQSALQGTAWHVTLRNDAGRSIAGTASHPPGAAELRTADSGQYWEQVVQYQFAGTGGDFQPPRSKTLTVLLAGPGGSGAVTWTFAGTAVASRDPQAFVPYLGTALAALCVLLLAALVVTRPPSARLS